MTKDVTNNTQLGKSFFKEKSRLITLMLCFSCFHIKNTLPDANKTITIKERVKEINPTKEITDIQNKQPITV
jgi:hypothetical protein